MPTNEKLEKDLRLLEEKMDSKFATMEENRDTRFADIVKQIGEMKLVMSRMERMMEGMIGKIPGVNVTPENSTVMPKEEAKIVHGDQPLASDTQTEGVLENEVAKDDGNPGEANIFVETPMPNNFTKWHELVEGRSVRSAPDVSKDEVFSLYKFVSFVGGGFHYVGISVGKGSGIMFRFKKLREVTCGANFWTVGCHNSYSLLIKFSNLILVYNTLDDQKIREIADCLGFDGYNQQSHNFSENLSNVYMSVGNGGLGGVKESDELEPMMSKKEMEKVKVEGDENYNSRGAGIAQNGFDIEALDLYEEMWRENFKPNNMTFLGVLSDCAGSVDYDFMCFLLDRPQTKEAINVSKEEDLDKIFLNEFSHVQQIHANCKVLLITHHQRACLEMMDRMVMCQEGIYEWLYRWVQSEVVCWLESTMSRPGKSKEGDNEVFRTVLIANNVPLLNQEAIASVYSATDVREIKEKGAKASLFDLLSNSLALSIHGYTWIKTVLTLLMLVGMEKNLKNGTHLPGEVDTMMVSDSSVVESQPLKTIMSIAPLAISTSGRASLWVGLPVTVTTDKETGERKLEAGAKVLADRDIVCTDEVDPKNDVGIFNEKGKNSTTHVLLDDAVGSMQKLSIKKRPSEKEKREINLLAEQGGNLMLMENGEELLDKENIIENIVKRSPKKRIWKKARKEIVMVKKREALKEEIEKLPENLRRWRTNGKQWQCHRKDGDDKKLCKFHYLPARHRQYGGMELEALKLQRNLDKCTHKYVKGKLTKLKKKWESKQPRHTSQGVISAGSILISNLETRLLLRGRKCDEMSWRRKTRAGHEQCLVKRCVLPGEV